MKVSIIIPVYNVEKYIKRCLQSVIHQTYDNIECILVDDKGNDNSCEIAREIVSSYRGNIEFLICEHPINMGLSAARNTGIKKSSGDYLFFLDSDDSLPPDAIASLVKIAVERGTPEIVSGVTREIFSDEAYHDIPTRDFVGNLSIFRGYINQEWNVIACNKLVCRDIFILNNTWFLQGITHEDVMWSFEIATYVNSIVGCPHVTYNYYKGDRDSISRSPLSPKRVDDNITILERKASYIGKTCDDLLLARHIKNDAISLIYTLVRQNFSFPKIKKFYKRVSILLKRPVFKGISSSVPFYRKMVFACLSVLGRFGG